MLDAISRKLPPLIHNFNASSRYLGPADPIGISFHALENRTQVVYSSATLLDQYGAPMLNQDGTPLKAFADQTIELAAGKDLPWEKDVDLISWDGTLLNGSQLPDGKYKLDFHLVDGDDNPSPGVQADFTVDRTSPAFSLLEGSNVLISSAIGERETTMDLNAWAQSEGELEIASAPATTATEFVLTAEDSVTGIQSFYMEPVDEDGFPIGDEPISYIYYETAQSSISIPIGPLRSGTYRIEVADAAGNWTDAYFRVDTAPDNIIVKRSWAMVEQEIINVRGGTASGMSLSSKTIQVEAVNSVSGLREFSITSGGNTIASWSSSTPAYFHSETFYAYGGNELQPGLYKIKAISEGGRELTASLTVGDYEARISSPDNTTAAFNSSVGDFLASVEVEVKTGLGLKSIDLYNRDVDPSLGPMQTFPFSGETAAVIQTFVNLRPGQYAYEGRAVDGETFWNAFELIRGTFAPNISAGVPGAAWGNYVMREGALQPELKPGQNLFQPSNNYTSAIVRPQCIHYADPFTFCPEIFIGGQFRQAQLTEQGIDPDTNEPFSYHYCLVGVGGELMDVSVFTGQSADNQPVAAGVLGQGIWGSVSAIFRTGDSPNGLSEYPFGSNVIASGFPPGTYGPTCPTQIFAIGRYFQYRADVAAQPAEIVTNCTLDQNGQCQSGPYTGFPALSHTLNAAPSYSYPALFPLIDGIGISTGVGQAMLPGERPYVWPGMTNPIALPQFGEAFFADVTASGEIDFQILHNQAPPPGFVSVPSNTVFQFQPSAGFVFGKATLTYHFDPALVTATQRSQMRLIRIIDEFTRTFEDITTSVGDDFIRGESASLGRFMAVFPKSALDIVIMSTPTIAGQPEATLLSRNYSVNLVAPDTTTALLADLLDALAAQGFYRISNIFGASPSPATFLPPAGLTIRYSTDTFDSIGADEMSAVVLALFPESGLYSIPIGQALDFQNHLINLSMSSMSGFYGVFLKHRDAAPPATALEIHGEYYFGPGNVVFLSTSAAIGFSATDAGTAGGWASEVAQTLFLDSPPITPPALSAQTTSQFFPFADFLPLAPGAHTMYFGSYDYAGNYEALNEEAVFVDSAPPQSIVQVGDVAVSSTPDGDIIISTFIFPVFVSSTTTLDIATSTFIFLESMDIILGNASGVAEVDFLLDESFEECGQDPYCYSESYWGPFQIEPGTHTLYVSAVDNVGNREPAQAFNIRVISIGADSLGPRTVLTISTPQAIAGTMTFVSGQTILNLSSLDDLTSTGDEKGFGIAFQQLSVDVSTWLPFTNSSPTVGQIFSSSFTLASAPDGTHVLSFFAEDTSQNREDIRFATVTVDNTPPGISGIFPSIGSFIAGRDIMKIGFTVTDNYDPSPSSQAFLSRIADIDGVALTTPTVLSVSSGQIVDLSSLEMGLWILEISAADFVQNSTTSYGEPFEVLHDTLPPRTALVLSTPSVYGEINYVSDSGSISLLPIDDLARISDSIGLGVAYSAYSFDNGAYQPYSGPFAPPASGTHTLSYFSEDVLGHRESTHTALVAVDVLSPSVQFGIADNAWINTASTQIALGFSDPQVVEGIPGSGASTPTLHTFLDLQELFGISNPSAEGATLALSGLSEGPHTLRITIADRVGNSTATYLNFSVDATPPNAVILSPTSSCVRDRRPLLSGALSDYGSGLSVGSLKMMLDNSPVQASIASNGMPGGSLGPWSTAGQLPSALFSHAIVIAKDRMYVLGGNESGYLTSAVKSAAIKADSTITAGSWRSEASLPSARHGHQAVLVGNRIYVLGGNNGSMSLNEVFYGDMDSDGKIAGWQQQPNSDMPYSGGTDQFGTVAVTIRAPDQKDYIYIMGGENYTCVVHPEVFYAQVCGEGLCVPAGKTPVSPNSPWVHTADLLQGLDYFEATAVQNTLYIYVPGGNAQGCGDSVQSTVYYAKPKEDGSLEGWSTSNSPLPMPLQDHMVLSAGNYIYVAGGSTCHCPTMASLSGVYFAQAKADGTLEVQQNGSAWTSGPNLPKSLWLAKGGVWKNRLYVAGGSNIPEGTQSWIYTAELPPGAAPTASTMTYTPLADLGEGYHDLLVSGKDIAGNESSASANFRVDSTPPSLSLTIEGQPVVAGQTLFVTTTQPTFTATYNDAGSGIAPASFKLTLDNGEFTANPYTPEQALSQGAHTVSVSIADIAGNTASLSAGFEVDSIIPLVAISTPADGVYLSTSRPELKAVFEDYGSGLSTAALKLKLDAITAPAQYSFGAVGEAGTPGAFSKVGELPVPVTNHAVVIANGWMYVIGGYIGGTGTSAVHYAQFTSTGGIGAWHEGPPLPTPKQSHAAVFAQNRIFVLGGWNGSTIVNDVLYAKIKEDGSFDGDWNPLPSLPFLGGTDIFSAVTVNVIKAGNQDYIYAIGGENVSCTVHKAVYYAKVCQEDVLCLPENQTSAGGPWAATTELPIGLDLFQAVNVADTLYIYIPGGNAAGCGDALQATVYRNKADETDGSLGPWVQLSTSLPRPLEDHMVVSGGKFIYTAGGSTCHCETNTSLADVYFTKIDDQGELVTEWRSDPSYSLPQGLTKPAGGVWNNRIYVTGGWHWPGGLFSKDIYVSEINTGKIVTSTAAYTPETALAEGPHTVRAECQDLAGNAGIANSTFHIDLTPPVSFLEVLGSSRVYNGALYASGAGNQMRISGKDYPEADPSGIAMSYWKENGGDFAASTSTFTLEDGTHMIVFHSVDIAGNIEADTSTFITVDSVSPGAITDLAAASASTHSITMAWTMPGDNGGLGEILDPEVRIHYSTEIISFSTNAAQVSISLQNAEPGSAQAYLLEGLQEGTTYYASAFVRDTAGNWSAASNLFAAQTQAVARSADSLVTLMSYLPGLEISTIPFESASEALFIATSTQGLSPLTLFYEIGAGTEPVVFSPPAVLSFVFDLPQGASIEEAAIYRYDPLAQPPAWSSEPISNQQRSQLPDGRYQITGELANASLYGVFLRADLLPPRTLLSFGEPNHQNEETFISSMTVMALAASDDRDVVGDGLGVGVAQILVSVDSAAFSAYAPPLVVPNPGPHVLRYYGIDKAGNQEVVHAASIHVDTAAPLISIASPKAGDRYYAGGSPVNIAFAVLDDNDPAPQSAAFLVQVQDNGTPRGTRPDIIYVTTGQAIAPMDMDDGVWELRVSATDFVKNAAFAASGGFAVIHDVKPPRTFAAIGAPQVPGPGGVLIVSRTTPINLTSLDDLTEPEDGQGFGTSFQHLEVDGVFRSTFANPAPETGQPFSSTFTLTTDMDGLRLVGFYAQDVFGNRETLRSASVAVDQTPPIASITADAELIPTQDGFLVASPSVTITVALEDPMAGGVRSGLASGEYILDGIAGEFSFNPGDASAQPVSRFLTAGVHDLEVRAADMLGNAYAKAWRITVSQDNVPPQVALLSPCPAAAGACRVYEGLVTVLGTAADANLAGYQLEYAAGENAGAGYVLISSGTAPASDGTLGLWNTASLSGYQTLRLSAVDAAGNAASVSANVFVGEPVRNLVLGSQKTLHHPHGVASLNGKMYVADTNADKILVFDQGGSLGASYGNVRKIEPYFDKPKALDVDGAGNIYVADTHHHRVVKLSPAGAFLFDIGLAKQQKNGDKSFQPGTGNGQFRHPSGIAVGPEGKIYVSDTDNRRVQVFDPNGSFFRAFSLPPTDLQVDPDDEDGDDAAPMGIDVDAVGSIYVADAKGHRALVFDAAGNLKLSIGSKGEGAGQFRRPEGIAAAPDGSCIFVSDRKLERILKFDLKGNMALDFGRHGEIKDNKPLPAEVVFNKPIGLALTPDGNLLVADRNNERIQGFGLPAGHVLVASGEPGGKKLMTAMAEGGPADSGIAVDDQYARMTMEKGKGGILQGPDLASVMVPAGALPEDTEITVARAESDAGRAGALTKKRLAEASKPVEYGPEGTIFSAPVTIILPYSRDSLAAKGLSEDKLNVHYWNAAKGEWEALDSTVNKDERTVSAKTTHFSLYQVLGEPQLGAMADPEAAFIFRDIYVFPNPARAGAKPVIHLAVGKADEVIIKIYNVAGQQVHAASIDRAPQIIGSEYAYEYAWDGHIPSGVYFYSFEAKKGGYSSIRGTGKLAVVR